MWLWWMQNPGTNSIEIGSFYITWIWKKSSNPPGAGRTGRLVVLGLSLLFLNDNISIPCSLTLFRPLQKRSFLTASFVVLAGLVPSEARRPWATWFSSLLARRTETPAFFTAVFTSLPRLVLTFLCKLEKTKDFKRPFHCLSICCVPATLKSFLKATSELHMTRQISYFGVTLDGTEFKNSLPLSPKLVHHLSKLHLRLCWQSSGEDPMSEHLATPT